MEELDCSLRPRNALGPWEDIRYWIDFGDDPEKLRGHFSQIIKQTVRAFDDFTKSLKDPVRLLEPESGRKLLAPFLVSFPLIFFASIEMRLGRLDDAEIRLNEMGPDAYLERIYLPRHRRLLKLIGQLRLANGDPQRLSKLMEWVTE